MPFDGALCDKKLFGYLAVRLPLRDKGGNLAFAPGKPTKVRSGGAARRRRLRAPIRWPRSRNSLGRCDSLVQRHSPTLGPGFGEPLLAKADAGRAHVAAG